MIVDTVLKFLTSIVKKMSLRDYIIVFLIFATASVAWAANSYRSDLIDTKLEHEKYKLEVEEKKYDKQLLELKTEKMVLIEKVQKLYVEKESHKLKSEEWKVKFDNSIKNIPDKTKIRKEVDKINDAQKLCDLLSKYGLSCFVYSTD